MRGIDKLWYKHEKNGLNVLNRMSELQQINTNAR